MDNNTKILLCLMTSWVVCMLASPIVIKLMTRLKVRQTILKYVDKHEGKFGTPTMGGLAFLIAMSVATILFCMSEHKIGIIAVCTTLAYGILGFLDDFIKVWHKENQGLKAYQKIIGQVGIALIVAVFCYKEVGSSIILPFTSKTIDLSWGYIPFAMLVFTAMTNAVNLTDGLDGLAGSTSAVVFVFWLVVCWTTMQEWTHLGNVVEQKYYLSLCYFSAAMLGGVMGFVWQNAYPAKIFMGDTGSLTLGGAMACLGLFAKNPLILALVGIMYVISCISVIVQVVYFKATGKRVFLMAPLHHHLEYKGLKESKIVAYYTIITAVACIVAVIGYVG